MTDKQIRDEAMRQVMWECGITANDVTRYIADAVAEKVVRDEDGDGWIPVSEWLPECEKAVEVTVERHLPTKTIYLTCRAIYEDGTVWSQDSRFRWENFDNYKYDEERDDWLVPEGWFEAVSYAEEFEAIDDFVIAWREVGEPYKPE